jgi:hypothetical protein
MSSVFKTVAVSSRSFADVRGDRFRAAYFSAAFARVRPGSWPRQPVASESRHVVRCVWSEILLATGSGTFGGASGDAAAQHSMG